jgi:NitT/TauT family transport system substrate-binding protein
LCGAFSLEPPLGLTLESLLMTIRLGRRSVVALPLRAAIAAPFALAGASLAGISPKSAIASALFQDDSTPVASPTSVTMGYVAALIFAPVFVAKELGYYEKHGIDMKLEPLPGGSDMVLLTASGDFDAGIGGVGPAFWNAVQSELPLEIIAPGHQEGNPVATPLMVSKARFDSGELNSVAALKGKHVSVNARGATEYWLSKALETGGLTFADVTIETLAFPDAVTALASDAIDAAMIGEPLATKAEQDGIAVRLATDFDVQNIQVTAVFANTDWLAEHSDLATGLVAGYLEAARHLTNGGFDDPATLEIISQYTGVPADLIAAAVKPVYAVDGHIDVAGLSTMQDFFRSQDLLEYDENLDPATFITTQYVDAALAEIGPAATPVS